METRMDSCFMMKDDVIILKSNVTRPDPPRDIGKLKF